MEASKIMEVSPKTVQRRLNRSLLLLSEKLGDLRPASNSPARRSMTDEDRILELLENMMDSGMSPEEASAQDPDLLGEVRDRWERLQSVSTSIDAPFPERETAPGDDPLPPIYQGGELPKIPGYSVESLLGRGGMGVVYKATHLALGRPVAAQDAPGGGVCRPGRT